MSSCFNQSRRRVIECAYEVAVGLGVELFGREQGDNSLSYDGTSFSLEADFVCLEDRGRHHKRYDYHAV